ncbi:hypothetical protein ENUP19_0246G0014 [Entamoeba nuttalli]|uniref:Tetraspanin family protein n=2 Tax=Entamoeba nuttalli TaxID=412467 RepID=K2GSV7_ENTNP|nr:hypothetical protein ENU1_177210 [Entamoeba nuttalli P19]EKE38073.1 hypothetical protein ENU1_177210 [Entamoeba nuttalli P19]|eukprot:XP_008859584.1 hypothetical protein ENU1_177210 [Entamoeba nuttalli P19]
MNKNQSKKILCISQIVMSLLFLLIGLITSIKYMKQDFIGIRLISVGFSFIITGIIGVISGYFMSDTYPKKFSILLECFTVLFTIVLIITSIRLIYNVKKVNDQSLQLHSVELNFKCCGWNHYYDCNVTTPRGRNCYKAVGIGLKSLGYMSIIFLLLILFIESLLFCLYWITKSNKTHLEDQETDPLLPNEDDLAPF